MERPIPDTSVPPRDFRQRILRLCLTPLQTPWSTRPAAPSGRLVLFWHGDPPHITFIIWGVVFIITRVPKETPVPWPSVELEEGITRPHLPVLLRSDHVQLIAP
jgi:hypothetical protein